MTIVAVIFFPVVLLYQGWSFHVFRGRVKAPAGAARCTLPRPRRRAAGRGERMTDAARAIGS